MKTFELLSFPASRLITSLKRKSKGYVPRKSKDSEAEHAVFTFIKENDNDYLIHKVGLLMGIFGGLRRDELVKMTVDDVQDNGSCFN